jgi:methionyl-tRNA formyltransferase
MQMEEGLDTGAILLQRKLDLGRKNAGQVTEELAEIGASALLDYLEQPTTPAAQPQDGITYASKIDKAEARIDWTKSAEQIERQVRAFNPVPGAWFEALGERIKLLEADFVEETGGKAGEVLDESLSIACGSGYIHPLKLQRAGRSPLTPSEMLRGFPIHKGTMLL